MNWKQVAFWVVVGVLVDIATRATEKKLVSLFPNTQAILGEQQ